MKRQLFLELHATDINNIGDFIVSKCNETAFNFINKWPDWGENIGVIIYGENCSGKTHLALSWCKQARAEYLNKDNLTEENVIKYMDKKNCNIVIDDIDKIITDLTTAKAVFHLFNIIKNNSGSLVITANTPINTWYCPLPDLVSRLKTLPSVIIEKPDEELLQTLLIKFFSDRQVKISADVVSYLATRIKRSFFTLSQLVKRLDEEALSQKRPITIPLARNIIKELEENS